MLFPTRKRLNSAWVHREEHAFGPKALDYMHGVRVRMRLLLLLLQMVETLNKAGANSIWEYSLLDQSTSPTSCKPTYSDTRCVLLLLSMAH